MKQHIIDSHCHLHDTEFFGDTREEMYQRSREAGVAMCCVGTDVRSSREAVEFCRRHEACYPIVGIHPHEAKDNEVANIRELIQKNRDKIVGIGEIGLDYYYNYSPHDIQQKVLREQLAMAIEFGLPVSFHVRDSGEADKKGSVWRDFWPILDEFPRIRGVMHSFTDTKEHCDEALRRGLYIGVNGISTFTKDEAQQRVYKDIPLERLLIETDAPFLTPKPFRGKMNIPAYVGRVAEHQAVQRSIPLDDIIRTTTTNAEKVFGLSQ